MPPLRNRNRQDGATPLSLRLAEAFQYALELHGGQTRTRTARPYLGHLMSVAALVLHYGGDEEQAMAALLHDALEEGGGREVLEQIRRRFGERVARIVDGCTDAYDEPKPPWRARKEEYLARVRHAAAEVVLVSGADKLANVREIRLDHQRRGDAIWETFPGRREGALWYYRALVAALRQAVGTHPLVDDLDREVAELEKAAGAGR